MDLKRYQKWLRIPPKAFCGSSVVCQVLAIKIVDCHEQLTQMHTIDLVNCKVLESGFIILQDKSHSSVVNIVNINVGMNSKINTLITYSYYNRPANFNMHCTFRLIY